MPFLAVLSTEIPLLVLRLVDETPEPEDVKAGWTAFALFLLLLLAVGLLGFSLFKHLRKAQAAQDAGAYDGPADPSAGGSADEAEPRGKQPS